MEIIDEEITFEGFEPVKDQTINIIKVIGVGGGGGNAVENMYRQGIYNVSFAICNTDSQALESNAVPVKLQLGPGLGAGGDPEKGKSYANEDLDQINRIFSDNTQMVFVTAGMGGGTGTGAGPIIAKAAKEKGLLTIGVVTLPFLFEQKHKINKALEGVAEMRKCVDALLVVNNETLRDIYSDYTLENAFQKADEVLTNAIRSVAEVITRKGIVNRDFEDVKTVTADGGSAIITEGKASGEHRVEKALMNALKSPLMNNIDIRKAKRILYIIYQGDEAPLLTKELDYVTEFMNDLDDGEVDVNWGLYHDDTLGQEVKVSVIASGFDDNEEEEPEPAEELSPARAARIQALREKYYKTKPEEAVVINLSPNVDEIPEPDQEGPTIEEPINQPEEEEEEDYTDPVETKKETLKRTWGKFMDKLENFLKED